jgi:steroid delta-isomerase-like uncharacterized protein
MAEDNKDLSRRFFEVMSSRNVEWFDEVMSPDYVQHDPVLPEDTHGIEAIKETMSGYLDAFPDLKMTVRDQIAEGDKVFTRWVAEGTHQGELMGIPPSGNRVHVEGNRLRLSAPVDLKPPPRGTRVGEVGAICAGADGTVEMLAELGMMLTDAADRLADRAGHSNSRTLGC